MWIFFFQLFLSLPSCLILCMITPLHLAHCDSPISCNPCQSIQDSDRPFSNGEIFLSSLTSNPSIGNNSLSWGLRPRFNYEIWNTSCTSESCSSKSSLYTTSPTRCKIWKGPIKRGDSFPFTWNLRKPLMGDTFKYT
jgi:hypothetical protein